MKAKEGNSIVVILLSVIIILLVAGLAFFLFRYEALDEKYDDLEDQYEKLEHNSPTNVPDNSSSSINSNSNSNVSNSNVSNNTISRDQALQIALDDLKVSKSDVYELDVELENKIRYGGTVFEVSFDYNMYEYEYYIDPTSGKILDSFKSID